MYSLRLTCTATDVDLLSAELWDAGTEGIQEIDAGEKTILIAAFNGNSARDDLLARFASYSPEWQHADGIDWVRRTRDAWPARSIGSRLFLAPLWNADTTPPGRERLIHNPGLACGTGEHPCTQLALTALEACVTPGCSVVDVGTGSGILAIAALRLGAETAAGIDIDVAALQAASENFLLNKLTPTLAAGSAECVADESADVTVANISGSVLLSIIDQLVRITRVDGCLILTGFPETELRPFQRIFPDAEISQVAISQRSEWCCLTIRLS